MKSSQPPGGEAKPAAIEAADAADAQAGETPALPGTPPETEPAATPADPLADDVAPPSAQREFTAPLHAAKERLREDADESAPAQPAQSDYGSELKAARQRMDVTPSDVAASLHLEAAVIRAMEAGEASNLPAPVYVRGYIRAYANLVGLDADRLIASFDESNLVPEASAVPVTGGLGKRYSRGNLPQRRPGLFLGVIVAVIVVALAFTLWGVWRAFDWSFVTDVAGDQPAPAWRSEKPTGGGVEGDLAETGAMQDQQPSAPAGEQLAASSDAPASPAADPPAAELVFTLTEDSWLEVSDRTEVVYAKMGQAEQSVSVSGQPPFTIKIGNAAGVELRYEGELVALAPHTQGGVANLVVH